MSRTVVKKGSEEILGNILIDLKRSSKVENLKVQSRRSCNNKYAIALTQITNTELFAFIAVLAFKFLTRKVLFINRKHNRNC